MQNAFLKLYVKALVLRESLKDENGQDLVEYALVLAVVVLALVGGMKALATGINTAFVGIGTKVNANLALN